VPGLVRSDETTAEVHPVARPRVRPPTDVRGDRDGDHRGQTSLRFPRFASPAIGTGLGKSFGAKAALARLDLMVPVRRRIGPLQKGSLMLTDFLRRLSGRLFSVAVVTARRATQIFQNSTPGL
jgi:hypothetical protein